MLLCLQAGSSKADCQSDCEAVISAADKVIADLHSEVDTLTQIKDSQTKQIASLMVSEQEKTQELSSILRNPWVIGTVGFLVGGITVLYLKR